MKTNKYIALFFLFLSILILWRMLLPGYVLSLDMSWAPEIPLVWQANGLNNSYPIRILLHTLTFIIPSWVVQKIMLVSLFFLLFYLPWRFLILIKNKTARIFSACIFVLNPFVYSRMLAGQWMPLFGYALLPFFFYALIKISQDPSRRRIFVLVLALIALGVFSIHFFILAFIFLTIFVSVQIIRDQNITLLCSVLVAVSLCLFLQLYWIIPAFLREAPLEAQFDRQHFVAFSAAGNDEIPVMVNVAFLGGFWGEDLAWKYYFLWPQQQPLFLLAATIIIILILFGIDQGLRNPETKVYMRVFLGLGILAYLTSLGLAGTVFKPLNLFLYEHLPFWAGLRDSHKIAGILGLFYALFAGLGVEVFLVKLEMKKHLGRVTSFASIIIFALPVIFGMYMWGGFHGQLNPTWYPKEWYEAKTILAMAPEGEKALVLPWHGYLSLDFAEQLVTANPAPSFFGYDRVIASRSVDFAGIHDQETDQAYIELDRLMQNATSSSPAVLQSELKRRGITYLLIIGNSALSDSSDGLVYWVGKDAVFPLLQGKTLISSDSLTLKLLQ